MVEEIEKSTLPDSDVNIDDVPLPSMPLNLSQFGACLLLIFIATIIACSAEYVKYKYLYSSDDYKVKYFNIWWIWILIFDFILKSILLINYITSPLPALYFI